MAVPDESDQSRSAGPVLEGMTLDEVPNQSTHRAFDAVPSMAQSSRATITLLIVCANTIQFISNSITFTGGLSITQDLGGKAGPGQANWMPASYPLTQSAFVLITGRLGAIYGHKRLTILGCCIFGVFSLVNAFCTNYEAFIAARALTGVGGGIFMPNAVSMITVMIPPGRSRNLFLGFFAASPPLGGSLGAVLTGVFIDSVGWKWLFVLIQAPSVGWSAPSVIGCLSATAVLFGAFLIWEKKFSKEPIMPLSIFKAPSFSALLCVVLLSYMGFGIAIWYSISWMQVFRNTSVLQTGINFIPFGIASLIAVFLTAWLVSRVSAQWIMAVGVGVILVASILLATMPEQQTYWAQVFPAMVLTGFCPDLVFVAAQVIASNSVNRRQQGVASSLVGTLNLYGNSLGLGIAAVIETEVDKKGAEATSGYRAALYFSAGIALLGLCLDICFVRMPKIDHNGWDDDGVAETERTGLEATSTALSL
ncbi:hypothetical protein TruAng_011420 [Truncatella angustata]|nr:hypothetical protein TruAng_011420 [Truncatella angustata]